jgi:hypothetical protein
MPDIILEEDHPRIISANFGWDWLCSFRGILEFLPFFHQIYKNDEGYICFVFLPKLSSFIDWCCYYTQVSYTGSCEHEKRARTPRWVIRFTSKLQVKREPSNDYFIKILFLLSKWFQKKRFLWEFPIGSYVKLSSAVVAILVGVLKCRT